MTCENCGRGASAGDNALKVWANWVVKSPYCISGGYPYGQYRPAPRSHLVRESGPVRASPVPRTGYCTLTLNRDRGADR